MELPDRIVTDNGPPFTSKEFDSFLKMNGIQHIFTPPFHPSSKRAAENAVKTVKNAIKKAKCDGKVINVAVQQFLFSYRNSIHATTNVSPAEKIYSRKLSNTKLQRF